MVPFSSTEPILDTYQAVVSAFCEFLTVAVHTILYDRNIYPRASFLNTRKYNYPVRQSRHPKVCKWIQDAVAAVEVEILKGTVKQTSLVIHTPASTPLERYVFSTANFPHVPPTEHLTPFETPLPTTDPPSSPPSSPSSNPPMPIPLSPSQTIPLPPFQHSPLIDLTSQFRAIFTRLDTLTSTLLPLPPHCSFTVAIELRDRPLGEPPIGWPQPWVAAVPELQESGGREAEQSEQTSGGIGGAGSGIGEESGIEKSRVENGEIGKDRGNQVGSRGGGEEMRGGRSGSRNGREPSGVKTTPIRAVEAGAFVMEVWIEEGRGKAEALREMDLEKEREKEGGGSQV